jgi:competence protein ComEA
MEINLWKKKVSIKKEYIAVTILCAIVATGLFTYFILNNSSGIKFEEFGDKINMQTSVVQKNENLSTPTVTDTIDIYITGCIKKPGIYKILKGGILNEVIKKAGGFTSEADWSNINLVYQLNENVMIKILKKGQVKNSESADNPAGIGTLLETDDGGVVSKASSEKKNSKINLNTATEAELDSLPGVGPKTATDIIVYRQTNGKFKSINDLRKISGIGESKFSKIKDLITV